ncbi:hypothetical protein ABZX65_26750 [Streptomyces sp. NPDC003300]|uniref:hypothetical protein n=1 Tax=unclassified Streptomyces TaxID=2593676 RepID=UPI0033B0C04B
MRAPDPNDPWVRAILRAYRLKPRHIGIGRLAIDGHAYHRRQRNRIKRRRR